MTTTPLTAEQLAAIKAREAAATDGPWLYDHGLLRGGGHIGRRQLAEMHSFSPYHRAEADGTFIAEARTDVPALLAELDRMAAELDRVRTELATTQAQIAAVLALPSIGHEALELMDPEQYHQAIGYNDGLAASTHAINDAAARPGA